MPAHNRFALFKAPERCFLDVAHAFLCLLKAPVRVNVRPHAQRNGSWPSAVNVLLLRGM
jgi:hypothetical protein